MAMEPSSLTQLLRHPLLRFGGQAVLNDRAVRDWMHERWRCADDSVDSS